MHYEFIDQGIDFDEKYNYDKKNSSKIRLRSELSLVQRVTIGFYPFGSFEEQGEQIDRIPICQFYAEKEEKEEEEEEEDAQMLRWEIGVFFC